MIEEFKKFIMRGNVLDLSVGVVIGSAFTAIVNGITTGLITPLIGLMVSLLTGQASLEGAFSILDVNFGGVTFAFGSVITAIITFLITGFVLFLIVKAANTAQAKLVKKEEEEEAAAEPVPTSEDYLREIRDLLASGK